MGWTGIDKQGYVQRFKAIGRKWLPGCSEKDKMNFQPRLGGQVGVKYQGFGGMVRLIMKKILSNEPGLEKPRHLSADAYSFIGSDTSAY